MVERKQPATANLAQELILQELQFRVSPLEKGMSYLEHRVFKNGDATMEKQLDRHEARLQDLEHRARQATSSVRGMALDIVKLAIVAVGVWLLTQMFTPTPSVAPPPPTRYYNQPSVPFP